MTDSAHKLSSTAIIMEDHLWSIYRSMGNVKVGQELQRSIYIVPGTKLDGYITSKHYTTP